MNVSEAARPTSLAGDVFVVDDNEAVGMVVRDILELRGLRTQLFHNPSAALEALEAAPTKPRLLVTDFMMAPLNGNELIAVCKQRAPELRTVLYSGWSAEEIRRRQRVQPDCFISTPFLPAMLMEAVESALARPSSPPPGPASPPRQ